MVCAKVMLLSGNEAIARGAADAGCKIGCGYPGTPSTETLEAFAKADGVYAEWCTNEKVALEVAMGASCGGARVLVTMKHVGVNVAADPLFTAAYTGVGGGVVILAADDPGMHSSQNEQDSRYYGAAAKMLVLEPADSQEAYDMARAGFELSERFDVPVIIKSTVRISHTKSPVRLVDEADRPTLPQKPYEKHQDKWVMMPLYAKQRRIEQLKRIEELGRWADSSPLNRMEMADPAIGIVCSGAAYQHVREAMEGASVLKLGATWPLPEGLLREFADSVDSLYVVEEASTYLRDAVRSIGIEVSITPHPLSVAGELDPQMIRAAFFSEAEGGSPYEPLGLTSRVGVKPADIPARPPSLCPGCPHRLVFKELSRLHAIVTGDIGCYTLGALPPLSSMDSCVDMGASISMAHGMELACAGLEHAPIVAIIGDSTFAHSGIESLASTAYNAGAGTICILDNRTTAMTGRQGNPFNGCALQSASRDGHQLDLPEVVRALGVADVQCVDPNDMHAVREALKQATSATDELSVIVFKSPCVLLERNRKPALSVSPASCTGCGICLTLGCPAIGREVEAGLAYIDSQMCIGCGQCQQYCRFGAIEG